jgi:hypothetical protein
MSNGLWTNTALGTMPQNMILQVCDTVGGVVYSARWFGRGYGWQVISFPRGFTPAAQPTYWLSYA